MTEPDDPTAESVQRSWWRRALGTRIDVTPLRTSRDFRILFVVSTVFNLGAMFGYVAVPYQLYALTSSNLAVGAMGAVQLIPLLVFGLYGGALADHVDRRQLLIGTGVAQTLLIGVLLANSMLDRPHVWVLYVVGALISVASSLQRPSREALIPRVVRHDELPAAVALSTIGGQLGLLVGPAVGGLLIARYGPPIAYGIESVGFLVATVMLFWLHRYPPLEESTRPSWAAIAEGITYAVRRKDLLGTYVVDMVGMFLAMPIVLFPALATVVLKEPDMLGLLYTAEGIGAIVASLTSGWTSRVHHHGRAVTLAAAAWGAAIGVSGLMPSAWLVIVFLALAGAFDTISQIFRGVIWHQTIPDSMRGRLAGIEMLSYSVGPLGGQLRSGLVADLTSVRTSIVSGGILCVLGVGATAALLRDFWRYDARTDVYAVTQRNLRAERDAELTAHDQLIARDEPPA